jgi:hypothetical protein
MYLQYVSRRVIYDSAFADEHDGSLCISFEFEYRIDSFADSAHFTVY